jgi:peptide methionine sulfoxide reductase MsrA
MEGVKRVVVGYTGGQQISPTFRHLQDHTQALWIEYNPKKVSYKQLLAMWKDNDYPWEPETLANRSALFVTNETQRQEAYQFVTALAQSRPNCCIYVDIEDATTFYKAEEEQQDFVAKQAKLAREQYLLWANDAAPSGLYMIAE